MARYPVAGDVRLEDQRSLTVRRTRGPQHTFTVGVLPWQQVPVLCAPVLAGETLKSGMVQIRVISDPVNSALMGWWFEFYLFYVRVGDLDGADAVRAAASDPSQNLTALNAGISIPYYHSRASTPSWALQCHSPVSRAYFRKEGENWNDNMVGNYPGVQFMGSCWMDSLYTDTELGPPAGADTWQLQWSAFQAARSSKLTTNTWGEWLAKSGVAVPPQLVETVQDYRIPELVRFVRDFAFPQPTVDPATGAIRSTLQWSMAERIDRRRYFAEPGFLFGLVVIRPKVVATGLTQAGVDSLILNSDGFMPPEFDTDPHTALQKFTAAGNLSPLSAVTVDHWVDRRDLFLYGDQWVNNAAKGVNSVALPTSTLTNKKYPSLTESRALFVDTAAGLVSVDGIASFRIASRIGVDATD